MFTLTPTVHLKTTTRCQVTSGARWQILVASYQPRSQVLSCEPVWFIPASQLIFIGVFFCWNEKETRSAHLEFTRHIKWSPYPQWFVPKCQNCADAPNVVFSAASPSWFIGSCILKHPENSVSLKHRTPEFTLSWFAFLICNGDLYLLKTPSEKHVAPRISKTVF